MSSWHSTARSGGWLWIPMNPLSVAEGVQDSLEDARTYLRHETGAHYDAPRGDAFLTGMFGAIFVGAGCLLAGASRH